MRLRDWQQGEWEAVRETYLDNQLARLGKLAELSYRAGIRRFRITVSDEDATLGFSLYDMQVRMGRGPDSEDVTTYLRLQLTKVIRIFSRIKNLPDPRRCHICNRKKAVEKPCANQECRPDEPPPLRDTQKLNDLGNLLLDLLERPT